MNVCMQSQGLTLRPQPSVSSSRKGRAVVQNVRASSSKEDSSDVYLGFEKGDYDRSKGRKGRVIVDDPTKYPGKENRGLFIGATGGWAGGEAALDKLKEEIKREAKTKQAGSSKPAQAAPKPATKQDGSPIYLGFGKDELDLRKSGVSGKVIYDDPSKYPDKDNVGALTGLTGGFAGGERGLWGFVETGQVQIRKPGQPGGQLISPLSIAFTLFLAGAAGAVLLTVLYNAEGVNSL